MLWLINQATAGEITASGGGKPAAPATEEPATEEEKKGALSAGGASFNDFKIDMNA
jgi:hypothetical protein